MDINQSIRQAVQRNNTLLRHSFFIATKSSDEHDIFKAWLVRDAEFEGEYELPVLKPCYQKPNGAIPFDKASSSGINNQWLHFYIDDRRFECLWNNPMAYFNRLKQYEGIISPDFSVYRDMPFAIQVWNTYRNRAPAYWMQSNGMNVIPNIRWGDERTYGFCFDGISKYSTVAVSTNGCIQSREDKKYFKRGLIEMLNRLEPKTVINYSSTPDDIFFPCKDHGAEVLQIDNYNNAIRKKVLL